MAKGFKLRFSFSSFRLCRLKQPSSLPRTPSPATCRFSPFNPKSFDISFPSVPEPPPSTPTRPFLKSLLSPKSVQVDCGCRSMSYSQSHYKSSKYRARSRTEYHLEGQDHPDLRLYNSSVSEVSDGDVWSNRFREDPMKKREKTKKKGKGKASVPVSTSSLDSGWFSSDDEETESLISSPRSSVSSYDFGYSLGNFNERPMNEIRGRKKKKNKTTNSEIRRMKSCVSNSRRGSEKALPERSEFPARKSVVGRLTPRRVEGKVKESFAVVKDSEDPCEDFKRSMLEMILEKQMFEAEDLEQLLLCFLSLNSRHHHLAIVEAFAQVSEALFCDTPNSPGISVNPLG